MTAMKIRSATPEDATALLAIYAQYIDTPVTFEYELPSVPEFAQRVVDTSTNYPYLVCLDGNHILGYAYAHRLQPREAYQWSAELSIYLDRNFTGQGFGRKLYALLIELLKAQGVRTVYGCVTVPNAPSEKLHASLGFRRIGDFRNAGFKNNQWHTVTWFEKAIGDYDTPSPFIPFPELPPELFEKMRRHVAGSFRDYS